MAGPQHLALCRAGGGRGLSAAQKELDPDKRAALFIKMNDIFCSANVILPIVARTRVAACSNTLVPELQRLGQRSVDGRSLVSRGMIPRVTRAWRQDARPMTEYLIRRLLVAIPSLLGISLILFTVLALAPGDPFEELATNPNIPPEVRANLRGQVRHRRSDPGPLPALARGYGAGRLGLLLREPRRRR